MILRFNNEAEFFVGWFSKSEGLKMAELKCLVFKNDDLEFLKKQYPGIYGLLGSKLADYDGSHQVWRSGSEDEYRELWNRFTYEIASATDSSGKVSDDGLRLRHMWDQA